MVFGLRKEQNEERAMMVGFKRKKGKQGKNFWEEDEGNAEQGNACFLNAFAPFLYSH